MSKTIQDAYIVAAVRTPVARRKGAFRSVRPDDMLAHVLRGVVASCTDLDPNEISDVIVGCAMPEAEQGLNVARMGVLLAGLPNTVSAFTINRYCSSGLNSIAIAANSIRLGEADVCIGAGTESMTVMSQMLGNKLAANPRYFQDDNRSLAYGMGLTAERVASQWKIDRERQDQFAVASHKKACAAIAAGNFADEILAYQISNHLPDFASKSINIKHSQFAQDEGPRSDSSMENLAKLRPVFAAKGSVTAGNSSQMSDGAAAVLLMSEAAVKRYNVKPLARFVNFAVGGVAPEIMGVGPIAAIPRSLKQAGLRLEQIDHIELNEAFAAQALAVMDELHLDPSKVNPYGGAIALGHPLGATGAIRAATIIAAMQRNKSKYGMISMCIGAGMGAAGIFENLN